MNKSIRVIISLFILCGVFFIAALIGKGADMGVTQLGFFMIITSNLTALWLGNTFIGKSNA